MSAGRPDAVVQRVSSSRRTGFTLLEVMAAVGILAVWFIVIAGAAMQALRAEGVNRRRLEAALIADRAMAQLEATTVDGVVPEVSNEVLEEGDYTIYIDVAALANPNPRAPNRRAAPAPQVQDAAPPDLLEFLAIEMPDRLPNLRTLDVRVAWDEAGFERSVSRTSFAFDVTTARAAFDEAGIPAPDAGTPPALPPTDEPTAPEPEADE